ARRARASAQHAEDVALFHDDDLLAVDLDLGAAPLAEQHLVTLLEIERHELAALVARARTDGEDLALLRLLGGGVGDDDAAGGLRLAVEALDQDAVMEWTEFHGKRSSVANEPENSGKTLRILALWHRECQGVPVIRASGSPCQEIRVARTVAENRRELA